jgi:hypothetical protein
VRLVMGAFGLVELTLDGFAVLLYVCVRAMYPAPSPSTRYFVSWSARHKHGRCASLSERGSRGSVTRHR